METRLQLQTKLENILGSRNVYFQPPESVKLKYPCIVYSLSSIYDRFANDIRYKSKSRYTLTIIDKDPDSEIISAVRGMNYCSFDRSFKSENLNHFVFTLYF